RGGPFLDLGNQPQGVRAGIDRMGEATEIVALDGGGTEMFAPRKDSGDFSLLNIQDLLKAVHGEADSIRLPWRKSKRIDWRRGDEEKTSNHAKNACKPGTIH